MAKAKTTTLGILGGGQLGRMSALAAARLGIRAVVFTDEKNSPASQVAAQAIVASYDDKAALKRFAAAVDVISYEFENIPVETVRYLKKLKPVYPDEKLLAVSQDRLREKAFLNSIGIPTAQWARIENPSQADTVLKRWKHKACIIKTTRFGYDGKGQMKYTAGDAKDHKNAALRKLGKGPFIVESLVDFACEISVIAARDAKGKTVCYGPMLNEHRNHILHKTTYPAPLDAKTAQRAVAMTKKLAKAVDLRGVLALEMFVTRDGKILANEIAPRTHNSGHWTIDACAVSQFENHVRAVCGLSVAEPACHSAATMVNLIGDDIHKRDQYLEKPGACVHLYGKAEPHPGRKMGHVTFLTRHPKNIDIK